MCSLLRKWRQIQSPLVTVITGKSNFSINKKIHIFPYTSPRFASFTRVVPQHNIESKRSLSSTLAGDFELIYRRLMSKDEIREFETVMPDVVNDLVSIAERHKSKEAGEWFGKSLLYNLSLSNNKIGLIPVLTYKSLAKGDQLNPEHLKLAHILGWCFEMMICFILMVDDLVDKSTTRRGQLCWHTLEEVGLFAINDAILIENGLYELLNKHFRKLDCYVDLIELFHQNTFKCICGQSFDMLLTKKNVTTFNMETYDSLVMNKTSSHFFYLPVFVGLHLAGVKDRKVFDESESIIFDLGHYSQVQNDFHDCFGKYEYTGKIGTDIETNKCSWLAVKCMELANAEQRSIIAECYGHNDPQKIARVKQIYEELDMLNIYAKYEEETCRRILMNIQKTSDAVPRDILIEILCQIYDKQIK
uniref:Farnesyl pyrophosphate synthase n=1 Tax=Zeugodacus cucurbitae TaxID=28588 RepID=A0A0A1XCJ1_ZEUCU